uniref:Uncharacterized protein n=1 Tax=Graphocephala atropunctata TaxID=36148 RepID=A0A1B6KCM0_9HEMI
MLKKYLKDSQEQNNILTSSSSHPLQLTLNLTVNYTRSPQFHLVAFTKTGSRCWSREHEVFSYFSVQNIKQQSLLCTPNSNKNKRKHQVPCFQLEYLQFTQI